MSLESLEKALNTLKEALRDVERYPVVLTVRDGAIQRFEYTYSLLLRTLRRVMEFGGDAREDIDGLGFRDLIREANVRGLLVGTVETWEGFRDKRNRTSHAYDELQAQAVFSGIPAFTAEVEAFLVRARRYLGNNSA